MYKAVPQEKTLEKVLKHYNEKSPKLPSAEGVKIAVHIKYENSSVIVNMTKVCNFFSILNDA